MLQVATTRLSSLGKWIEKWSQNILPKLPKSLHLHTSNFPTHPLLVESHSSFYGYQLSYGSMQCSYPRYAPILSKSIGANKVPLYKIGPPLPSQASESHPLLPQHHLNHTTTPKLPFHLQCFFPPSKFHFTPSQKFSLTPL